MTGTADPFSKSPLRAVLMAVPVLLLAGCVAGGGGPSAAATSAAPATSLSASGFYLRASQTQALAPQYTFGWLPRVTIADGMYVNGMVAIPTIYPGPIYTGLSERPISAKGIGQIIAEAQADGLLGDKTDFSGTAMPGSITAHIELVVDGVTHELTGPLSGDATAISAGPGTAGAFTSFWNQIESIDAWLASELGQSSPYSPTSLAVMLTPPADAAAGFTPQETTWPLAGTFAMFGSAMSVAEYRCGVVSGADLGKLLPVVQASNQLSQFVDSTGAKRSLQVRVLLPGESDPCM